MHQMNSQNKKEFREDSGFIWGMNEPNMLSTSRLIAKRQFFKVNDNQSTVRGLHNQSRVFPPNNDDINTLRRIEHTPEKLKKDLVGGNDESKRYYHMTNKHFLNRKKEIENKENSNRNSNLNSLLDSSDQSNNKSNDSKSKSKENSFRKPMNSGSSFEKKFMTKNKKFEFVDVTQVKCNLASEFQKINYKENDVFDQIKNDKLLRHTSNIISSSSGSSNQSPIDAPQDYIQNPFDKIEKTIEFQNYHFQQPLGSQMTVTESLLEGVNQKIIFTQESQIPLLEENLNFKPRARQINYDYLSEEVMHEQKNFVESKHKQTNIKNKFDGNINFTDPEGKTQYFKIFKDNEIGFGSKWDHCLKISKQDEDVPTDEEMRVRGEMFCVAQIKEAFETIFVHKETHKVYNVRYMKKKS